MTGHRPSVDALFRLRACQLGPRAVGVLLTGMGKDGARGLWRIREAGGHTIAQDRGTSVVYGMPRVAAELGAATEVLPLDQIARARCCGAAARAAPAVRARRRRMTTAAGKVQTRACRADFRIGAPRRRGAGHGPWLLRRNLSARSRCPDRRPQPFPAARGPGRRPDQPEIRAEPDGVADQRAAEGGVRREQAGGQAVRWRPDHPRA